MQLSNCNITHVLIFSYIEGPGWLIELGSWIT